MGAAMGEVVVLWWRHSSGSGMDVRRIRELQCAATRSNGMMGAIGAGLDAWQKVLHCGKGGIGVGRLWTVLCGWFDSPAPASTRHSTGEEMQLRSNLFGAPR